MTWITLPIDLHQRDPKLLPLARLRSLVVLVHH